MKDYNNIKTMSGRIKWFCQKKGFGFLVPDDGGSDIFIHSNVVANFSGESIFEGVCLKVSVIDTETGLHAIQILENYDSFYVAIERLAELAKITVKELESTQIEPARVKWFDDVRGFGFLNGFGHSEDILIHSQVLQLCGVKLMQSGEGVAVRVRRINGRLIALQIQSWFAQQTGSVDGVDAPPEGIAMGVVAQL